jgi:hypothetical protein
VTLVKLWAQIMDLLSSQIVVEDTVTSHSKVPELKDLVERARLDWLEARAYFDNVTDPDLVDYAIFCIEAAEKKYMYLLKLAREQGLRLNFGIPEKQIVSELPGLQQSP